MRFSNRNENRSEKKVLKFCCSLCVQWHRCCCCSAIQRRWTDARRVDFIQMIRLCFTASYISYRFRFGFHCHRHRFVVINIMTMIRVLCATLATCLSQRYEIPLFYVLCILYLYSFSRRVDERLPSQSLGSRLSVVQLRQQQQPNPIIIYSCDVARAFVCVLILCFPFLHAESSLFQFIFGVGKWLFCKHYKIDTKKERVARFTPWNLIIPNQIFNFRVALCVCDRNNASDRIHINMHRALSRKLI